MLDHAKNQLLTQVGTETPMGQLLRRYWMPIAAVSEFDNRLHQAGASDGRRPHALQRSQRRVRPDRPPLSAPPRRPLLRLRRAMRAALQLSRLAVRRNGPVRRATLGRRRRCPKRASKTRSTSRRIRWKPRPDCSGRISDRSPRLWFPIGSRSHGRTVSSRSSSRTCPATGCSARKIPSIRCISNGCT